VRALCICTPTLVALASGRVARWRGVAVRRRRRGRMDGRLWDEQALYAAAEQDMLKGVHVIVGTPEYLSRGSVSGNLRLQHVRMPLLCTQHTATPSTHRPAHTLQA
jgi:hypothetical protein